MIMVGSCSVALKCEDNCNGCSTTSIVCYGDDDATLPVVVSVLPPYTQCFSYVAVKNTVIDLSDSNFEHLPKLKTLNITTNDPNSEAGLFVDSSQQSVFAQLAQLKILKVHVLWFFITRLDDLFLPLVNLEELDLSQTRVLHIHHLRRTLFGLSNSTALKTINLSYIHLNGDEKHSTFNLTWFLEPLQNCPIRRLYLANNSFKAIYPGIIRRTPLLEYIDVSHNRLMPGFGMLSLLSSAFFQETLLHKGLKEVDFSYQDSFAEEQTHGLLGSGPRFHHLERFTHSRNLNFGSFQEKVASLNPNDIVSEYWSECSSVLQYDACEIFSPNCSYIVDYLRHNHSEFCKLMYMSIYPPSMAFKTYSGIPCSAVPRFDDIYQKNCLGCTVFPTMGSMKHLKLSNRDISDKKFNRIYTQMDPSVCFHLSNQLEYLDLSGNVALVHLFPDQQFSITGLIHIKVLNVSSTGITSVFDSVLLSFPNLQVMDMSRNKITFYKERPVSLSPNRDIQFLNFTHNLITFVPQDLFSNLASLRKLDLSHNNIQNFEFNISGLYSLENLNLEYNMIPEIPEATRKQLIQLTERIAPRVITVDLSNNQLACSCSNFPSLSFMIQTKPTNLVFKNFNEYFCHNRFDDKIHLHNMNLHSMWFSCLGAGAYVGMGFAGAFVIITIILLLAVTIYRKRWWFRYQYFLVHRVWKNYKKIATIDTPFEYDLFVSYNHCDNQWVDDVLQPKLEDELGLRLCLHHRDFRLGEIITEQIIESVQSSKKTLFILSKSFLASTWCHFEIQMAQSRLFTTGQDVILLALLEPLPDRMVSKTLKGLLETRTYVEWTENDTYGQKLFWEKIYESVQAPISQPFDLEERAPPPEIQTEDSRDPPSEEAAARDTEPLLSSSGSELSTNMHQVQVHV